MVRFNLDYLGTTVVDKRFSNPMVPWVTADVKRRKKVQKITLIIENGEMIGVNKENVTLFHHHVQSIARFCHEPNNMRTFMYLVRDEAEPVLHCYLYQTSEFEDVVEIFQTMKENVRDHPGRIPTKSHSSAASLTSLCPDISPSNSQFFEVLYVGKIKVSHRKVPDSFIDDALEKIRLHEEEKNKKYLEQNNDYQKSKSLEIGAKILNNNNNSVSNNNNTSDILHSDNGSDRNSDISVSNSNENIDKKIGDRGAVSPALSDESVGTKGELISNNGVNLFKTGGDIKEESICDISNKDNDKEKDGDSDSSKNETDSEKNEKIQNEIGYKRNRTGSLGVIEIFNKRRSDDSNHSHNRTMLFYVGRTDLRLISPDRKQVLLHKNLKDVISCIQGVQNHEHFGFISRDSDCYVGYVFKCESDSVADDVVSVITQSFHATKECKEYKQPVLSCEHCPMVWFHKLCAEIEGLSDKKTQMTILKKIESLPVEEQDNIHTKFLGAESSDIKEQNEFLMILLRSHCEAKQTRHVHDTAENRSEFLNQYLGGNTIFMKAKRSLTSSFDQLLKRKGSQLDNSQSSSKESLHRKSDLALNECDSNGRHRSSTVGSSDGEKMRKELKNHGDNNPNEAELLKKQFHKEKSVERDNKGQSKKPSFPEIAAVAVNNQKIERALQSSADTLDGYLENENCKTPMINIFLKVGSTTKTPPHGRLSLDESNQTPSGSWRQAIFNRVVTPGKPDECEEREIRRRTKEELRELWKKAINQQLLLIRMEKENARLRARQEEATVKRIKLEYDELGSHSKEYMGIWDLISTKDNRITSSRIDHTMLLQAIRQGIPRAKRGDVWHYLAIQFCLKQPPFDSTGFPNYDVCYEDLLKQLTSFQHAILIDLGRTFPNHPYFASPLGPGQLALFNLLKAYSLLDPQVGYCQGLSFVAGVLLLHMSEETAFLLLRHLMFRRGLRKQYLPDMAALQVQLYQLSRLLHDTLPKLYEHFDRNEIAPTLYAASWILTLFASQFPLGFVTRVFDLLFLENTTDIIFRVVMALLEEHKDELLSRSSFEEIMDYLKNDVPKMDSAQLEKIMKKVLTMDISKHLHEYEVEYHVLQEEMSTPRPEIEQLKRLELENRRLTDQNLALIDQLEIVNKQTARLEKSRSNQQSTINRLETQIRNLEITIATLGDFISDITEEYRDIEIPGDIRRIITNLELAEQRSSKQFRNEQNLKKKLDKNAILRRSKTSMGFYEKKEAANLEELYTVDDLPNGTKFGDKYPAKVEKQEEVNKPEPQKPILKGVPLKVIIDDDDDDKRRVHNSAPNLTSIITSGVSSFFNASHSQMLKNQKNKKEFSGKFQENIVIGNGKTNEGFSDSPQPTRKFSSDIGSLNLKDSIISSQKKDKIIKSKECKSLNNLELSNSNHSDNSSPCKNNSIISDNASSRIHPLDTCNDVNITYNGTTKLKSLKPGHRFNRNHTIDLIPVNLESLKIKEDYSESRQEKNVIDSKILKVCDSVTEKF